jgi:hypothetical protein
MISVKINAEKVLLNLTHMMRKMPYETKKALSITAQYGINIIQDRTAKGDGINKEFKDYNPIYAQRKALGWPVTKTQRSFGGDPSGIVNLNLRGEMLSSMTSKASPSKATIFFSRKAEANKAFWNNKQRPFFGFNDKEQRKLRAVFRKAFEL